MLILSCATIGEGENNTGRAPQSGSPLLFIPRPPTAELRCQCWRGDGLAWPVAWAGVALGVAVG